MGKFPLYVRKHPYFPMEMPITLSVDKKAGFSAFFHRQEEKDRTYTQLSTAFNGYPQKFVENFQTLSPWAN